ncbi:MAG: hypothetical protein LBQ57_08345 [Spirochaetales bacterium]|jgi:hypothetical protein|nr:hypothetical protein [Spirochaetales bacterium]
MAAKIHYDDNIFYAATLVKTLKNGFALEIDPEYFAEKIHEDLLFAGTALSRIYLSLKANAHLITRTEHLRSLLRAKRDFTGLLESILAKKTPFSVSLEANFPKLKICRAEQIRDIEEIKAHIENCRQEDSAVEHDVISGEEFRFLLTPEEQADTKQ